MSGHSKWAGIKHKKAIADAKKGAAYTKVIREITACARQGGGNPETNFGLRAAMAKAKEINMPADNVKNAIKKGTGELPGVSYENVMYEAYGPGGVAILVDALTDNKNRAASEIRNLLSKKNGNMAGAGAVSWMFTKKGYILIDKKLIEEDKLLSIVLDAGAEDLKSEGDNYEVTCAPTDFEKIKNVLKEKNITPQSAEITMIPSSTVKVTGNDAKALLALIEALEDHEDVQNVYANFDIPDEIFEEISSEEK
jgi:YebC/PmpR family DNA-binding regulatory protein